MKKLLIVLVALFIASCEPPPPSQIISVDPIPEMQYEGTQFDGTIPMDIKSIRFPTCSNGQVWCNKSWCGGGWNGKCYDLDHWCKMYFNNQNVELLGYKYIAGSYGKIQGVIIFYKDK